MVGQGRPDMAAELSKTKAWITRHVGDMTPEVELVMYHMVSIRQTKFYPSRNRIVM